MSARFDSWPEADFEVHVRDQGLTRSVTPVGEIDLGNVDEVRKPLHGAMTRRFETIVLDFGQTTFLDSTAIALVISTRKAAALHGVRFVVLPGAPALRRIFQIAGLTKDLGLPGADELHPDAA
jgi:anti-anti-sigma factor